VTHALPLEGLGVSKPTGAIAAGKSRTLVVFFRPGGRYRLYCQVGGHERLGMKATVQVH
jgi:uncharacterized cupredoxin-like copper-binding protein